MDALFLAIGVGTALVGSFVIKRSTTVLPIAQVTLKALCRDRS
ncbi:MAG: hypothetical protein ABIJ25_01880 [Pseudomonadota bacterium]